MAATYFMGARSGKKKSNGEWFGNFLLLHKNQYGQWAIDPFWFADQKTYDMALDQAVPYAAVYITLNPELRVTSCEFLDDPPILDICD